MARDAGSRGHAPELRALPSVEELAASLDGVPHALAVRAAREAVAARRERLLAGTAADDWDARADAQLFTASAASAPVNEQISSSRCAWREPRAPCSRSYSRFE